jgi:hypothetical protein
MDGEMYPRRRFLSEPILWWVFGIFLAIDAGVMAIVLLDAYRLSRQNQDFLSSGQVLRELRTKAAEEVVAKFETYDNGFWKVSFDHPEGYAVAEYPVDDDGTVDLQMLKNGQDNRFFDTTVTVRLATSSDFGKYLTKPYNQYPGYRRITVAGRRAVGFADPEREGDDGQVIIVDDGRNGREIKITFSALREDAKAIVADITRTLRLASREKIEEAVKTGWRRYVGDPIVVIYPEDYTLEKKVAGPIEVRGEGGRLEIEVVRGQLATPSAQQRFRGIQNAKESIPDEYFETNYEVTIRVSIFYDGTDSYQHTVLQEIAQSITLKAQ